MPENDLGTAHGNIRIDFDDKASAQTTAALLKIQKQMEALDNRFQKFEKTFEVYDREVQKNTVNIDKNTKKHALLNKGILGAHKNFTTLIKDVQDVSKNVNKMSDAFTRINEYSRPVLAAVKVVTAFNRNVEAGTGHAAAFGKALKSANLASVVFNREVLAMGLGVNKTMRQMPKWTQDSYKYAAGMVTAGVAVNKFSKGLDPVKLTRYIDSFGKIEAVRSFRLAHLEADNAIRVLTNTLRAAPSGLQKFSQSFSDIGKNTRGFLAGTALLTSGLNEIADRFRWLGKIPKPILYSLATSIADIVPAALTQLSKALIGTSNIFEGLLDGAKQLSGGFLVLPGLFATIGAAALPLVAVFGGLKSKFKDVFSDDYWKSIIALYSLPQHLLPLGKVLKDISDDFKAMQRNLQVLAFKGLEEQLKTLSSVYLPLFEQNASKVIISLRHIKDELVGFALAGQTQKDFSSIFTNTAVALENVRRATRPAADGIRDIAVVGNAWIADMSVGLPNITKKFAEWAQINRANGHIFDWIDNARHGVVDLFKGSEQLGQSLFRLVTVFRTNSGTGFLDTFLTSMTKLNAAVERSTTVGFLAQVANGVREIASNKIDNVKDLASSIGSFFSTLAPLIKELSSAFTFGFIPSLKFALQELGYVLTAFHALGIDTLIGLVYGLSKGWEVFSLLCVPLIAKLRIIGGLFLTLTNASKFLSSLETGLTGIGLAFTKFGPAGEKAGNAIANFGGGFQKVASGLFTFISRLTLVGATVGIVSTLIANTHGDFDEFQKTLDASGKAAQQFKTDIEEAFLHNGGLTGGDVTKTLNDRLDQLQQNLTNTAEKAPGVWDKIGAGFADLWSDLTKTPKEFANEGLLENIKKAADFSTIGDNARDAASGIAELRKNGVDLAAVLNGSDQDFQSFVAAIEQGGDAAKKLNPNLNLTADQGRAVAKAMGEVHGQTQQAADDMARLGPNGVAAALGFEKLSKAANDVQSKFEAVKEVMQALGLLTVNADQAAVRFGDDLNDLVKNVQDAIVAGEDLNNIFTAQGKLNIDNSQSARNLSSVFSGLSNDFINAVVSGHDMTAFLANLDTQLEALAPILGKSKEELKKFLEENAGFKPGVIKFTAQIATTKDEIAKGLIQLVAEAELNVKLPIKLDSEDTAKKLNDQIRAAFGGVSPFEAHGDVLQLQAGINLSPDQVQKLIGLLQKMGIDTSALGGGAPTTPPLPIPTQVIPALPGNNPFPGIPNALPGAQTSPIPSGPINQLPTIPGVGQGAPIANVDPNTLFDQGNTPAASTGMLDGLNQSLQGITQGLQAAAGAVSNFVQSLVDKFNDKDFLTSVHDSGLKFGEALAKGLTDGQSEAFRAAEQIAQGIKDRFHSSPPKKGPLSRHGDAAVWAGTQFVLAYARGVNAEAPRAAQAAGNVGSGVARSAAASALGGLGTPSTGGAGGVAFSASGGVGAGIGGAGYGGAGFSSALGGVAAGTPSYAAPGAGIEDAGKNFGKRLSQLVQFIGHAVDAFAKVGQVGLQFGKFLSDPLGEGKFFGTSLGARFGYRPIPPAKPGQLTPGQKLADRRLGLGLGAQPSFANANQYDPITGTIKPPPGQIGASSSKEDIQKAIVSQGLAAGAKPEDIAAALSVVDQEDRSYNPLQHQIGGGPGRGLFQQTPGAAGSQWGTEAQLQDPNWQIQRYWEAWKNTTGTTPAQRAHNIQAPDPIKGWKVGDLDQTMADNFKKVEEIIKAGPGATAPGALPGVGTTGGLLPIRAGLNIDNEPGGNTQQLIPNADQAARLAGLIWPGITKIGGTRADPGYEWHPNGRGLDIWVPGEEQTLDDHPSSPQTQQAGEQIAQYFLDNAQQFGIQGVIYNNVWRSGKDKSFGQDVQHGHGRHVHLSFLPQPAGQGPFQLGPQGQAQFPVGAPGVVPTTSFGPPTLPGAPPPSAPTSLWQYNATTGQYEPVNTPVGGGAGSSGTPQGSRLSQKIGPDGGIDVTDELTGKVVQHIPPGLTPGSAPVDIKDPNTGTVLGRVFPGAKGNEPPFLAPAEGLGPDGQPWNAQTSKAFYDQHPLQIAYPGGTPTADVNAIPGLFPGGQVQSQQQLVTGLGPDVQTQYAQGMQGQNAAQNLQLLEIQKQQLLAQGTGDNANNPQAAYARAQAQQIESYQNDIMSQNNLEEAPNPFQSGLDFLGQASGIAGDVINSIQAGIDAIGATADITDLVSRGVSNSKQITQIVDDTQKYITFAADVAQTTGDVLSTIGSLASAAGGSSGAPGGGAAGAALQAAGEVASLISAGLQAANAVIDLGQEAAKAVGTFIGPKLESLVGGAEGGLTGDVKFLLDTQDKQLYAYGADNPLDKRAHSLFNHGQPIPDTTRNQLVGTVNVYGGPGTDPRDDTRQMMYQIKASSLTAATSG